MFRYRTGKRLVVSIKPYSVDEFLQKCSSKRVVSVIHEVFSGTESPVTVFDKVAKHNSGSFLLESADQGVWSRFSFIGVDARGRLLQDHNGVVTWESLDGSGALPSNIGESLSSDGLTALQQLQSSWFTQFKEMEVPLLSGLVGHISWDVVSDLENIEVKVAKVKPLPRVSFSMFKNLIVVDHQSATLLFVSNVFIEGQSISELTKLHAQAMDSISTMQRAVLAPSDPYLAEVSLDQDPNASPNVDRELFLSMVDRAKEHVVRGDVFQVVLSQSFTAEVQVDPLDVYRVLRALNPSPYMYLINGADQFGDYAIVGSSPEALVTVTGDSVITHPIAGSRPRGKDWDEDHSFEEQLLADKKETAEHLMLVDLARNDLLKVCEPNSVAVTEFMQVHRFSHIMHLVSTVEGQLRKNLTPIDVFRATFPAGTLSGAPKPKALAIIEQLETTARGLYGGVCGYFDFAGNADLAIAIRTAVIRGNEATVQAGAGIVLDSNPTSEFEETKSKARAILRAIAAANSAKRIGK
ncbi:unannotated protein [freshwater metagenome]|uniref:Anthranilate synthase component 1 n=1 Tax=freshwater metagenome TaxID=449393 RepID=A0A6J6BL22_9ZZZZ